MAGYGKNITGVANIIFISRRGRTRRGLRIKIAIDPPDSFSPYADIAVVALDGDAIEGEIPAPLLAEVRRFPSLNSEVLTEYWNYEILTDELQRRLRSVA
jgi:hypothetical protein